MSDTRIIDQTTDSSLVDGDYVIVDSQNEGTRKYNLGKEIRDIKEDLSDLQAEIEGGGGGGGMSADFKQALHNILEKVAYIDGDGQTYLNALDSAMYPPVTAIRLNTNSLSFATLNSTQQLTATTTPSGGAVTWSSSNTSIATVSSSGLVTSKGYGSATITATSGSVSATCSVLVSQATLSSISAVYTQSGTVYTSDSLDSLKSDLVVTAHWSNSTTSTVPSADYTLSGTLTVGTSTVTVSYNGKTTTFTVLVSEQVAQPLYNWDFTQSLTDSVSSIVARTNGTRDSSGLIFDTSQQWLELPQVFQMNRTYEIDVYSIARNNTTEYGRLFMVDADTTTSSGGSGYIITGTKKNGDLFYNGGWETNIIVPISEDADGSYYNNSTVSFYVDNDGYISVYKNGVLLGTSQTALASSRIGQNVYIGSDSGDRLDNSTFTGFRIYNGQNISGLSSITCVYTQSGAVYTTNTLNSLKSDLVVTAHYANGTTTVINNYTLSGILTVGTSTITVSYGGKTTTFNVTVTEAPTSLLYSWDFKTSLTDTIQGTVATINLNTSFVEGTGVTFNAINGYINYQQVYARYRTYEIDVAEFQTSTNANHRRLICFDTDTGTNTGGAGLVYRANTGWRFYTGSAWDATTLTGTDGQTLFSGKTVKLYLDANGYAHVSYKTIGAADSTYVTLGSSTSPLNDFTNGLVVTGSDLSDALFATISGFRIYGGEK